MITLQIVRQTTTDPASTSHTVTVGSLSEAHEHLAFYRNDTDAISAFATDADGTYLGSGIAGHGRALSDWM